jgi:internalin A
MIAKQIYLLDCLFIAMSMFGCAESDSARQAYLDQVKAAMRQKAIAFASPAVIEAIEKGGGELSVCENKTVTSTNEPFCEVSLMNWTAKDLSLLKHVKSLKSLALYNVKDLTNEAAIALSDLRDVEILSGAPFNDENIHYVTRLANLRKLSLEYSAVTDRGLEYIGKLTALRSLNLRGAKITGRGLFYLTDLPVLEELGHLDSHEIGDNGMPALAKMVSLRAVALKSNKITDHGIKELSKSSSITGLGLEGTSITDAGLKDLAQLPSLKTLNITGGDISGAGLRHFKNAKTLEQLWLQDVDIGDQDVASLKDITSLKKLYLLGTSVTPNGIDQIQRARPDLKVITRLVH